MRNFTRDRNSMTALPLIGYAGQLRGIDDTSDQKMDRARERARALLAAAKKAKPPVFEVRVFDKMPAVEARSGATPIKTFRLRPGDKLGDVVVPSGVWTVDALVEELNQRSKFIVAAAIGPRAVAVADSAEHA